MNNQNIKKENRLIVISGPTAVGKTKTAVELAKLLHTEVVSADSMQVYRGMDIGTAKVTKEEMQGVPHSLIDVVDMTEDFNVTRFQEMASAEVARIQNLGKIPIVCGGTGFYIQALIYGMQFPEEEEDTGIREELLKKAQEDGGKSLWEELNILDPEYAALIPAQNIQRCARAVEFIRVHGIRFSEYNHLQAERKKKPKYDTKLFVLVDDREKMYERINRRVDRMMQAGLLEETGNLLKAGLQKQSTALQAIGYRQIVSYLDGGMTLDEAVEKIKQLSRNYAKKQITWYKKEPDVNWVHVGNNDAVEEIMKNLWPDVAAGKNGET